jgi:hypothetical protein
MLLHEHPSNEARERRGELPVNSVWFWGAGRMPEVARALPYGVLWSSHPLCAGLAAATGLELRALPHSGDQWLDRLRDSTASQPGLVVVDSLRGAACNDAQAWRGALAELEERWFAPLLAGLKRGALHALSLHALGADHGCASTITRLDHYKWWRPRRPLADYLEPVTT